MGLVGPGWTPAVESLSAAEDSASYIARRPALFYWVGSKGPCTDSPCQPGSISVAPLPALLPCSSSRLYCLSPTRPLPPSFPFLPLPDYSTRCSTSTAGAGGLCLRPAGAAAALPPRLGAPSCQALGAEERRSDCREQGG